MEQDQTLPTEEVILPEQPTLAEASEVKDHQKFKLADLQIPVDTVCLHNFSAVRDLGHYQDLSDQPESTRHQARVLELAKCLAGVPTNRLMIYLSSVKQGYKPSEDELDNLAKYYFFLTGRPFDEKPLNEGLDEIFERSIVTSSSRVFFMGTFNDLEERGFVSPEVLDLLESPQEKDINTKLFTSESASVMQKFQDSEIRKGEALRALSAMQEFPLLRAEVLNWFFLTFAHDLPALTPQIKKALLAVILKSYDEEAPEWTLIPAETAKTLADQIAECTKQTGNLTTIQGVAINEIVDKTDVFINCINTLHVNLEARAGGLI